MYKKSTLLGAALLVAVASMAPVMAKAQVKLIPGASGNSGVVSNKLCVPGTFGCNSNKRFKTAPKQNIPSGFERPVPGHSVDNKPTNKLPRVGGPRYHNVSCDRAKNILRAEGFRKIQVLFCVGSHYSFRAVQNGKRSFIVVRRHDGKIVSVSRI